MSSFENPAGVPRSAGLQLDAAQLGGATPVAPAVVTGGVFGRIVGIKNLQTEIVLKRMDRSPIDFTMSDADGNWRLTNVPVGKYQLNLDANNDLDERSYQVVNGNKVAVITILENQDTEVPLVLEMR